MNRTIEPRLGDLEVATQRSLRDVERAGGDFVRQAAENYQFNGLRFSLVEFLQLLQSLVNRQDLFGRLRARDVDSIESDLRSSASTFLPETGFRMINKNAPH